MSDSFDQLAPAFTTTTPTLEINTFLTGLQDLVQASDSGALLFTKIVAYADTKAKTNAVAAAPRDQEEDYTACGVISDACWRLERQKGTVWWVESSLSDISGEGGSKDASIDWHSVAVLLQNNQLFIMDPDFQPNPDGKKRRVNGLKGHQIVKALVRYLRESKKVSLVGGIYYSGGGNDGTKCRAMVQGYLKDWARKEFSLNVDNFEKIGA